VRVGTKDSQILVVTTTYLRLSSMQSKPLSPPVRLEVNRASGGPVEGGGGPVGGGGTTGSVGTMVHVLRSEEN
jgi:hypothetical protein